eukprot:TRINITY_DN4674_c2_g1_i1.p1 TRINITY_DN4674_c2_g1~~TRINITY_DN4674_c2_g1_i1.p1  ORF type:complete len:135 (+),score=13.13 TRINITY_DN4674_c2_g1_i1:206-610(+)
MAGPASMTMAVTLGHYILPIQFSVSCFGIFSNIPIETNIPSLTSKKRKYKIFHGHFRLIMLFAPQLSFLFASYQLAFLNLFKSRIFKTQEGNFFFCFCPKDNSSNDLCYFFTKDKPNNSVLLLLLPSFFVYFFF